MHYPNYTQTLWADVGNAMYAYMNQYLNLVSDAPSLGPELARDLIEIAYNLYFMYAALNIDAASLLGIDQSILTGWWAQVTMIQRDAYIQSAAMLGGKGSATSRFEQVCIYISGLTQLTAKEAISVVRNKESHTGTCPVPYCYVCGANSLSGAAQSYWSHVDSCMKGKMYGYVGDKKYYPLQIPGDYYPNMDHVELIEAQLTKEGMLAYESIEETSIAAFQEMILFQRRAYFDALHDRYTPELLAREPIVIRFCYPLMHMIATGQLFEAYLYHPDADVEERRMESEYCLERLDAWVSMIDGENLPKNMEMDWDGEWLSKDFVRKRNRDYLIPEVPLQMAPAYHPTRYNTQSNAIRTILPAKGMLPFWDPILVPQASD